MSWSVDWAEGESASSPDETVSAEKARDVKGSDASVKGHARIVSVNNLVVKEREIAREKNRDERESAEIVSDAKVTGTASVSVEKETPDEIESPLGLDRIASEALMAQEDESPGTFKGKSGAWSGKSKSSKK